MALSNTGVIEVRTTGSDNNGGGFKTGATGTDFSQQNAAQFALTSIATSGAGSTFNTATAAATMVGNYANIVSGTNFTAGIYEIISVVVGTSVTVDRACSTGVGAAGVINIGGALLTIGKALGIMTVTGLQCYVAAGTYSISTGLSTSAGITIANGIIRLIGYNTARGDLTPPTALTRPVIQVSAAVTGLTDANGGFRFENFTFDGNSKVATALSITGSYTTVFNCIIKNWAPTSNGVVLLWGEGNSLLQSEVTANAGTVSIVYGNSSDDCVIGNYIHDNTTTSAQVILLNAHGVIVEHNIIANNTGTSMQAIRANFYTGPIRSNVIYNNASDGIFIGATGYNMASEVSNNIIASNGGFGINANSMTPVVSDILFHHNAFFGNTSGARNNSNAGTGDVTLTALPFVSAASGNYALNNTSGAGSACKSVGYPGQMIGGGTGYADIGPLRHADPTIASTFIM